MKDPPEIVQTARRRYDTSWRDWLAEPPEQVVLSLQPPSSAELVSSFSAVDEWARGWVRWCAQHPHTSLRFANIRTSSGEQRVPTHIIFRGPGAIADAVGEAPRWGVIDGRYRRLRSAGWEDAVVRTHLTRIRDLADPDFDLVLEVVKWFREHPRSGLTMRRIPVAGLHTKWLAQYRGLVIPLVGGTDPLENDAPDITLADMDVLGLRRLPAQIDIILADPADRATAGGLRHLRAPIEEIANLPIHPDSVLVVENKESAVPIADSTGLVVIHSLGNHTGSLSQLPWAANVRSGYWGDLDRAGFTLLSRARKALPQVESLLMSPEDVREFSKFSVHDASRVDAPEPNLTAAERSALDLLGSNSPALRIEQERIPWDAVERALSAWLIDR